MQIADNRGIQSGLSAARFSEERDKILREVSPDPDKLDSFMESGEKQGATVELFGKKKKVEKNLEEIFRDAKPLPSSSLEMDGYMIPANEGKITHITLTKGMEGPAEENYMEALKTFMHAMPSARFTILTTSEGGKEQVQDSLRQWTREGSVADPERIQVINSGKAFSIWAQDSTLVVGNQVVQQDRMWFPGWQDGEVAAELAKADPKLEYRRMEGIFIDGGNQLATRDKLFVGSDAIAFMMKDMRSYPAKYEKIEGDLGIKAPDGMGGEELCKLILDRTFPHQKVIVVGHKGVQPAFHIDMAITPLAKPDPETGKPVMIVGDPSMALEVLRDLKEKDPEKFAGYEARTKAKVNAWVDNPLETLMDTLGGDRALQENFDAIAKGMAKNDYKIERVPYLGSQSLRNEPWITYNNSVIDGDNVFIPNYEIPELDDIGNRAFEKYGYTAVPVEMSAVSSMMGAINCITKVVERSYA